MKSVFLNDHQPRTVDNRKPWPQTTKRSLNGQKCCQKWYTQSTTTQFRKLIRTENTSTTSSQRSDNKKLHDTIFQRVEGGEAAKTWGYNWEKDGKIKILKVKSTKKRTRAGFGMLRTPIQIHVALTITFPHLHCMVANKNDPTFPFNLQIAYICVKGGRGKGEKGNNFIQATN